MSFESPFTSVFAPNPFSSPGGAPAAGAPAGKSDPTFTSIEAMPNFNSVLTDDSDNDYALGSANINFDTVVKPFTSSTGHDNGTAPRAWTPNGTDANLLVNAGDFAFDGFVFTTNTATRWSVCQKIGGTTTYAYDFYYDGANDLLGFDYTADGVQSTRTIVTKSLDIPINTWYYVCVSRVSNVLTFYAGPLAGSLTNLGTAAITADIYDSTSIIRWYFPDNGGNMAPIRVIIGEGIAPVIVPIAEFPSS